jgi:hypothetical protein
VTIPIKPKGPGLLSSAVKDKAPRKHRTSGLVDKTATAKGKAIQIIGAKVPRKK